VEVDELTSRPGLRSFAAVAAVVALLVLALLSALLAADVLRSRNRVESADAAFTSGVDRTPSWVADTFLPAGATQALLGLDDDLAFRSAVEAFWASKPRDALREFADVTRRSGAERRLARLADVDPSAERRAMALTMRGALLLEEARNTTTQREVFVRRAIEQFQKAVTLDPSNGDALYDLELALKLLRRSGTDSGGGGEGRAPLPAPGAGAATSGGGY
jgi:tetratricopeptide (TPR) repeat protein